MIERPDNTTVVKKGLVGPIRLEVEALRFISANTTIPVPRVHELVEAQGGTHASFTMDWIEGQPLGKVWRKMSSEQRRSVMRALGGFVQQLRTVCQQSSPGSIASLMGNPSYDMQISPSSLFGPFVDEKSYNDWRISTFSRFATASAATAEKLQKIRKDMPDNHRIYFTHGDISLHNVLVRVKGEKADDVSVVALLDWEEAGWRPEFWEAEKMIYGMADVIDWVTLVKEEVFSGHDYDDDMRREGQLLLISGPPR